MEQDVASFRDPSGFIFSKDNRLYRQINEVYAEHYQHLLESGLYHDLVQKGQLLPHEEVPSTILGGSNAWRIIQPQWVDFISYPYEWSFSQLQDAALLTLSIHRRALDYGMALKDASAYNIQFLAGKPVLIDTLSFEKYVEGQPWVAYRQFCQHFLAPLLLMSYRDLNLGQLSRLYIDGIPLDIVSKLLPLRSYFHLGSLMHLHLHARAQRHYSGERRTVPTRPLTRAAHLNIVNNLSRVIDSLHCRVETAWTDYYHGDSYSEAGMEHKLQLVEQYIVRAEPEVVWDLGANTGRFSRLASSKNIPTIAWDTDAGAVELNYREVRKSGERFLLPLIVDLTNPSPALGWANQERRSLVERANASVILALALIHHIAIGNNVPLARIAAFMAQLAPWLIIEFVPKTDPKVQELLATRSDIFTDYTQNGFEGAFKTLFDVVDCQRIHQSERLLYLMQRK